LSSPTIRVEATKKKEKRWLKERKGRKKAPIDLGPIRAAGKKVFCKRLAALEKEGSSRYVAAVRGRKKERGGERKRLFVFPNATAKTKGKRAHFIDGERQKKKRGRKVTT